MTKRIFLLSIISVFTILSSMAQLPIVLEGNIKDADRKILTARYKRYTSVIQENMKDPDSKITIAKIDRSPIAEFDYKKRGASIKSGYLHKESKTSFPNKIGKLRRTKISKGRNITVVYKDDNKTEVVVTLAPSKVGVEGRLRESYLAGTRMIPHRYRRAKPVIKLKKYVGDEYTCNGIDGIYLSSNENHLLSIYECGTWLLKIDISSPKLKKTGLETVKIKLVNQIDPAHLTALHPLAEKPKIGFSESDKSYISNLQAILSSAIKKTDWADYFIPYRERASGFPDMYLEMHIAAIEEYLQVQKGKAINSNEKRYLESLQKINSAGYLDEFLMEQYQEIMYVPAHWQLETVAYQKWKRQSRISVGLRKKDCAISYQ